MGLDISHDTWHGAYSSFMRWREKIAEIAGFPPLELMEGFYSNSPHSTNMFTLLDYAYPKGNELEMSGIRRLRDKLPIKWTLFESNPLTELLYHSDCDGEIEWQNCGPIADELEKLLPELSKLDNGGGHIGEWKTKTEQFITGLRLAHSKQETLLFG